MTIQELWTAIQAGGVPFTLLLFILALMTRRIVPGWLYEETQTRCERLETSAFDTLDLAKRMTAIVEDERRERRS